MLEGQDAIQDRLFMSMLDLHKSSKSPSVLSAFVPSGLQKLVSCYRWAGLRGRRAAAAGERHREVNKVRQIISCSVPVGWVGEIIVSTEMLSPLLCGSKMTFFFLLPLFSSTKSVTQSEIQGRDVQCATRMRNSASVPSRLWALLYKRYWWAEGGKGGNCGNCKRKGITCVRNK